MQSPPSILVYGRELRLLQSRCWVFKAAGFQVATASVLAAARRLAAQRRCDLLVICHTLAADELRDALAWADTLPDMKRIVMTAGFVPCPIPANEEVLSQFAGPRELVASAYRLLPVAQTV